MVNKTTITIGHLYPKQMNVYGDMGNIITLRYRLQKRGFTVQYEAVNSLEQLQTKPPDILIGGGGQDSNQEIIQDDLRTYGSYLREQCDTGLVCLMICGMYQLFGNRFIMAIGDEITGLGIIDMETRSGHNRLIGNSIVQSDYGQLVGFENHSGRTYLAPGIRSLGSVVKGSGNNGETGEEGAIVGNVFGTYMHGPGLAKNPGLADELIRRVLVRRGLESQLIEIDDTLEKKAAQYAAQRPR